MSGLFLAALVTRCEKLVMPEEEDPTATATAAEAPSLRSYRFAQPSRARLRTFRLCAAELENRGRRLHHRSVIRADACVLITVLFAACGASPTTPPPGATVAISDFKAGALGAPGNVAYGAQFTLAETGGKTGFAVDPQATYTLDSGLVLKYGFQPGTHVAAGQTMTFLQNGFFDMSGQSPSTRMMVTVGFTDDNGHTGSVSASSAVQLPARYYTVAGVVTDALSGAALVGSVVSIPTSGRTALSDDNGYYNLIVVPEGTVTIQASHVGYVTRTMSATIAGDTRVDFSLARQ